MAQIDIEKSQKTTALELFQQMKSDFDYSQITWTMCRYDETMTESRADELLEAFLQWFSAIPFVRSDQTFVMLETPIEDAFHAFVLNTKVYQEFCFKFLGFFFHHTPLKEESGLEIDKGIQDTIELLKTQFGTSLHFELKEWDRLCELGEAKVACVNCKGNELN